MASSSRRLLFILAGATGQTADGRLQTGIRGSDLRKTIEPDEHAWISVNAKSARQLSAAFLARFDVVANLITEPTQNRSTLEGLQGALRKFSGQVVNTPAAVLKTTRERIARTLQGVDGMIVPKTVLVQGGKLPFALQLLDNAELHAPMILRLAGTHRGVSILRFDTIEDASARLQTRGEYLAIEFVDFQSADGLYRKFRVFFIGRQIILRHMLVSDHWNVHADDRSRYMTSRPKLVAEERALFETDSDPFPPSVRRALEGVRERMDLDFFGMDFGVTRDGRVVLFEANATMSFFPYSADPQFDYLNRSFVPAQAAFRALLGLPARAQKPAYPIKLQSA